MNLYFVGCIHFIIFCFRDVNGNPGGELLLGGSDPNHYSGELKYIGLANETYWEFKMDE